ncbi:sigma-70 family RNA polymerase sigma factor [Rhodopirellula bahusiensis]|uniref:RNA polymerase subunit sigma-70 n=1 Tax=Rhodopirellula bahusiensis TaxID=2014065 RepID=A0A2G1W4T9_9BACT|nr:sigma-70 family RNA polymerase sigma factor [Rhodopirellula bahusiensis]PHQ34058.1 RNA polymerase subunit sigma-70 [Rhodopirellula bahusiensis]
MSDPSFQSFLNITENRSRIFAMIVAMVHDFDVAEELFQETVVEILKSEDTFDPSRRFLPWACGVAKHVVQRYWRRQKQMPTSGVNTMLAELAMVAVEGDDEVWRGERVALRRCFQKLSPNMQRLLLLRYGQNIKGQNLAEQASMRAGSIRTTLTRLRCQLRQCIHAQTVQV